MNSILRRRLDYPEYQNYLTSLSKNHPGLIKISVLFNHPDYPVLCVDITDPQTDPSRKQHALFTAMHSGVEYSGTNTLLLLINWLVSEDPGAVQIRQATRITLVPVPNPFVYQSGDLEMQHRSLFGNDPYSGPWDFDGVRDPETNVEAAAVQCLLDELKPELYIDCHGVFIDGQYMVENTGISVFGMNRPHHDEFVRSMNQAAEKAGHHTDTLSIRQKILPVRQDAAEKFPRRYLSCADRITPGVYAYHHYHTLSMVMEIGNEAGGFRRIKAALEGGLTLWPGEAEPGFPAGRLYGEGFYSIHPYSTEPAERREQRTALRREVDVMPLGSIHPQRPGRDRFLLLSPKTAEKLSRLPARLPVSESLSAFSGSPLADLVERINDGDYHILNLPGKLRKIEPVPFNAGITMPFRNVRNCRVKLNGVSADDRLRARDYGPFSCAFIGFPDGFPEQDMMIDLSYEYTPPDELLGEKIT